MQTTPVIVLDNGASTIKTNVVVMGSDANEDGDGVPEPRIITNAIVRQTKGDKQTFFGHEFEQCNDFASLHFRLPFERGCLTDWDAQKAIWDGLFSKEVLKVNTTDASLLVTEPYFNLPNIQEQYDQMVFEEYEFQSYCRCTPASLMPYGALFRREGGDGAPPECMLIVDSGYSFTHVVPMMNGKVVWKGARRIDVGGKVLTNHLKELLSFRQYDLMGETYISNDVKEKCCYVSMNYQEDIELSRRDPMKIVQEYILPKYADHRPGRVRVNEEILAPDDDVLRMGTERISVPELLFRPSDIGFSQAGLSQTIADAISSLAIDVHGLFWANIGLVGGNVMFPGFRDRLMSELRSLAPVEYEVRVYESSHPITAGYLGGCELARQPGFANVSVTRGEYQECGSNGCLRKFDSAVCQERENSGEARHVSVKETGRSRIRPRTSKIPEFSAGGGENPSRLSRSRAAKKG